MAASRGHAAGQRARPSDRVNPKTVDPVSNIDSYSDKDCYVKFCVNLNIFQGDIEENESGCFFSEHSIEWWLFHCLH